MSLPAADYLEALAPGAIAAVVGCGAMGVASPSCSRKPG